MSCTNDTEPGGCGVLVACVGACPPNDTGCEVSCVRMAPDGSPSVGLYENLTSCLASVCPGCPLPAAG